MTTTGSGERGERGERGATGDRGIRGNEGEQGDRGERGFDGAGSPGALDRLAAALEERNDKMAELIEAVTASTAQVVGLQARLDRRPTRHESSHRRRTAIASLVLLCWSFVAAGDQHVEACSPGWRAEQIIDRTILVPEDVTPEEFRRIAGTPPPRWCDVTFPLHTHQNSRWPTAPNLLGLGLYSVFLAGVLLWATGPRTWRRHGENEDEDDHHTHA